MISTHILDTSKGMPAKNVKVALENMQTGKWTLIQELLTNSDGRIEFECPKATGKYRLLFNCEEYFELNKIDSFFVETQVAFKISDTNRKYHVPLLLNPFGYSTYRGS